ncbi:TlpA family protein disulfide reductase [bacterium]|nr:TlpA family protein disulfide reductase [bacterium]
MNRNHAILIIIVLFTAPLIFFLEPKHPNDSLRTLEGATLSTTTGEKFKLSSLFTNKKVLFVFWSITCGTCIDEIPFVIKLHGKLKEKLTIIGVHPPGSPLSKIQKFVKKFPETIPYLLAIDDELKLTRLFDVTIMPKTVLISEHGDVLYTHLGFDPESEQEVENAITSKL